MLQGMSRDETERKLWKSKRRCGINSVESEGNHVRIMNRVAER